MRAGSPTTAPTHAFVCRSAEPRSFRAARTADKPGPIKHQFAECLCHMASCMGRTRYERILTDTQAAALNTPSLSHIISPRKINTYTAMHTDTSVHTHTYARYTCTHRLWHEELHREQDANTLTHEVSHRELVTMEVGQCEGFVTKKVHIAERSSPSDSQSGSVRRLHSLANSA